jgi:hypothetical protein
MLDRQRKQEAVDAFLITGLPELTISNAIGWLRNKKMDFVTWTVFLEAYQFENDHINMFDVSLLYSDLSIYTLSRTLNCLFWGSLDTKALTMIGLICIIKASVKIEWILILEEN